MLALTALNDAVREAGVEDEWLSTLQATVRTSLLDEGIVGTVASIATALLHLLGQAE